MLVAPASRYSSSLALTLSADPQAARGVVATLGVELAGTPCYMAPEQREGKALTPAVDWYAFGVTLHHAITAELSGA